MHRDAKTLLRESKALFAERHKWLREINDATQAGMGREMKLELGKEGVSQKTISNIENLEGDPLISTYAAAAAYWGLPVWSMMVPGTTRDMFEDLTKMMRLVRLMRDYLDCSDTQRSNIEGMAAGLAELNRHK
jgi:DNA-binding XRE family transcriptional regulator